MELAIGQNTGIAPVSLANLRPAWKTGESPNPGGRPKTSMFRKEAIRQLRQQIAPGVSRLACVVDGMIDKAIQDTTAFTAIRDTVDGRPQSSGDTGVAIANNVTVELVYVGGSE